MSAADGQVYEFERIDDLLKVPVARLSACLRDIEYAITLAHLTYGEQAVNVRGAWNWTDDGDHSCSVSENGKPLLRLEVRPSMTDDDDPEYEDDEDRACPACGGDGGDPMNDYVLPCEYCDGEGRIR